MATKVFALSVVVVLAAAFISPTLTKTCDPDPLEIVFAIDLSSSVLKPSFSCLKNFLKSEADHLPIGPDKIRLAVISFTGEVFVEVDLGSANDAQAFKTAIEAIPHRRGMTATGPAMQTARRTVFPKSRPGASKLLVVITDGTANVPGTTPEARELVKAESAELRSQGVRIHAIGALPKESKELVDEIAGSDDIAMIDDYCALNMASIDSLLKEKKCEVECTNLGSESFPGQCFHGTQRIVHVNHEHNKHLNRCEKSLTHEYKYCGKSHLCKDADLSVGNCVNGMRDIVTTWEDFDVQEQKCVLQRSVQQMDCKTIQICKEPVADIIFLLDSSDSMSSVDWGLQVKFVHHMVSNMKVAADAFRVGVIVFGREAWLDIPLRSAAKPDLLRRILRLNRRERQNTNTGEAIREARFEFEEQSRPGVNRIAILLTDGESNGERNAIQEAAKLESGGVTIMVIAVGAALKQSELEAVASAPISNNLFYPTNFGELINWAGKVMQQTCESITPPDPSLCDLPPKRLVSSCYKSLQKVTEIKYERDPQGKCTKKLESHTTSSCKVICTDPINGNQYYDGETWKTECSIFVCRRPSSQTEVFVPKTQECPGAENQCFGTSSGESFRCHDERGQLHGKCNCQAEKGSALLRVITADGNAKP